MLAEGQWVAGEERWVFALSPPLSNHRGTRLKIEAVFVVKPCLTMLKIERGTGKGGRRKLKIERPMERGLSVVRLSGAKGHSTRFEATWRGSGWPNRGVGRFSVVAES